MRLDAAGWRKVLAALPDITPGAGASPRVAFVASEDFASRSGSVWVWRPGRADPEPASEAYTGGAAGDWDILLVLGGSALEALCATGSCGIAALVRRGEVRPFLLRDAASLEAAGLADFVESLGLSFPRH